MQMLSYIKEYYNMKFYTKEDLDIFVTAKWIIIEEKEDIIITQQIYYIHLYLLVCIYNLQYVLYNFQQGGLYMATIRKNITLDPEIYKNFCKIAERKGIRMSTWINAKMKEFIEEEQERVIER